MIVEIDSNIFRSALKSGYANLENNKQAVNNLNVFPVPDGDTGTNMALTVQYAVKEMDESKADTIGEITFVCSNGALMGARGNSGVILSQLFRGFSKACQGKTVLNIKDLAAALQSASDMAYKAVMKPTEGTILTVAREMAEFAVENASSFNDCITFLESIIDRGKESLKNTPNLLAVLKEAGVVDAGGEGLLTIFHGILESLKGAPIELKDNIEVVETTEFGSEINSEILFAYCTEFLIMTYEDESYEKMLIDKLIKLGDSLVVVQDGQLIKIHVHTNEPWTAMKIAAGCGELTKIKIENMRQQHSELFEKQDGSNTVKYSDEEVEYVLISVSPGEGLSTILKDLGVTYVIEGGQTMNPSTQDFVDIIEKTNAKNYILFPNNSNIILAASQAKEISTKNVEVVATKTVPQAISALMNFNPLSDLTENVENMSGALQYVSTAQVTYAVRDSELNNVKIKKDDVIGIIEGDIEICEKNVQNAALKTVEKLVQDDTELLTLYYGADVKQKDAEKMLKTLQKQYESIDIELFYGGQPLYYYIISAE